MHNQLFSVAVIKVPTQEFDFWSIISCRYDKVLIEITLEKRQLTTGLYFYISEHVMHITVYVRNIGINS